MHHIHFLKLYTEPVFIYKLYIYLTIKYLQIPALAPILSPTQEERRRAQVIVML